MQAFQPPSVVQGGTTAKKRRVEDGPMPPLDASTTEMLRKVGSSPKDEEWVAPWADIFTLMHRQNMEGRANEYAEAVITLRKKAEELMQQRRTIQAACDQIYFTASREATQAHVKGLLEAAATGASPEFMQAAVRTVDELCPPALSTSQGKGGTGTGPDANSCASVHLGKGFPQPSVSLPPVEAIGLLSVPGKAAARSAETAASENQAGSAGTGQFLEIGEFAAAAAAAQQEAASQTHLSVSGLPEGIDETMFRTLFSRYGSIIWVKLVPGKREATVKYSSTDQAQAAIEALNGFSSNGVKLSVRFEKFENMAIPGLLSAS